MVKTRFLAVIAFFLVLNTVLNFHLIQEVIRADQSMISVNDGIVTEFITETAYQKIIQFKNPFGKTDKLFFPFSTDIVFNDTSGVNLIFLFFFRPFLSIHQATSLIVFINIFLACIFMFMLLRRFHISQSVSSLVAVIFAFSPFVSYRIQGHYTYTTHYFFPLLLLIFHTALREGKISKQIIYSITSGVFTALLFFANPYYFIFFMLSIFMYILYCLYFRCFHTKSLHRIILFIFFVSLGTITTLLPWIVVVKKVVKYSNFITDTSIYRSIILSADALSFIIPSEYNPLYAAIFKKLSWAPNPLPKLSYFFFYNWERFAYPGIIIVVCFILILIFRKRLPRKVKSMMSPPLFLSFFFLVLTLGPFLKIFNRWFIILDEGIKVYFPLPFLLVSFIPFLKIVSVPARFVAPFVFFASLVIAPFLDYVLRRNFFSKRTFFFIVFIIFFIDQFYIIPYHPSHTLPLKLYQYIKNDKSDSTVLEIPFTIRDGLQYRGYVHAISPMTGVLFHGKPIIGGYVSRVPSSIFNYYDNLPFISYVADIIDKGNFVLYKQQPREPKVRPFTASIKLVEREINFLRIKYILLKEDEKYTTSVVGLLKNLGFSSKMQDAGYILFERTLPFYDFDSVTFGSPEDFLYIGENIGPQEKGFRWAEGRSAQVFFSTNNEKKNTLHFDAASFHERQQVKIYINRKYTASQQISTKKESFTVDISGKVKKGVNEVFFEFSKSFRPFMVSSLNTDNRNLAVQFFSLSIN